MKKVRVDELFDPSEHFCLLVDENESFNQVIEELARQHKWRCAVVVDADKRLKGVISRRTILRWAQMKMGSRLAEPYTSMTDVWKLVGLAHRNTAGEIAQPTPGVKLSDDIQLALRVMMETDLIDIPVVDDSGIVLGDLTLSEILSKMIEIDRGKSEP